MINGMHWDRFFSSFVVFCTMTAGAEKNVDVSEGNTLTLPCNYREENSRIQTVFWELKSGDVIIAELYQGNLRKVHNKFKGRVEMTDPEGDLTISSISRNDVNSYRCVTLQGGIRVESPDGWINLNVLVKPDKFKITCSGNAYSTPSEDCSHIKKEAIKSIQCQVYSNPASNLVWSEIPTGCPISISGSAQDVGILQKQTSLLRDLCDGRYCCLAAYPKNIAITVKTCIVVGDLPQDPSSDLHTENEDHAPPSKPKDNKTVIIAVAVIVAFIFLVTVILVLKYLDKSRLREDCPVLCRCCPKADVKAFEPDTENVVSKEDDDNLNIEKDEFDENTDVNPIRYSFNESPSMTYAHGPPPYSNHVVDETAVKPDLIPRNRLKRQNSVDEEIVKSAGSPSAPWQQDLDDVDGPVPSPNDPFLDNANELTTNSNNTKDPFLAPMDNNQNNEHVPKKLKISIYRKRSSIPPGTKHKYIGANAFPT